MKKAYALGVVAADFDGDGWQDLYVACDSTRSLFYRNNGDGTFSEKGIAIGLAYDENGMEQAGMGAAVGDYDRDGSWTSPKRISSTTTRTSTGIWASRASRIGPSLPGWPSTRNTCCGAF